MELGAWNIGGVETWHRDGFKPTSGTMDDYPAGSLDHTVPFLLTLGTRTGSTYDSGLSAALKEQAVLIRSDLPALESDQARALLRFIQHRDASRLPCNARDASSRKYRFRTKTAERVGARLPHRCMGCAQQTSRERF